MYAFVQNIVHDFDNICRSCKCIILFHCYLIKNYCYPRNVLYRWTYRARYQPYRLIFQSISGDMFENDIYKMICYVYIDRAPKVIYRPIYRSYRPGFKSLVSTIEKMKCLCNKWVFSWNPDTSKEIVHFVHGVDPVFVVTLSTF